MPLKDVVESSLPLGADRRIMRAAHRMCCSLCGLPDSCTCADLSVKQIDLVGWVITKAQRCARRHLH